MVLAVGLIVFWSLSAESTVKIVMVEKVEEVENDSNTNNTIIAAEEEEEDPVIPIFTMFGCAESQEYSVGKAVDNNLTTYWKCDGNENAITLGLGGLRTVTQLDISWYKGDFMKNDFTIQAFAGLGFTNVMNAISTGNTDDFEEYELPTSVKAESIRIIVNFNVIEKAAINEVVVRGT